MADHYSQWIADRTDPPPSLDSHHFGSVPVSSERSVTQESDGSGSCTVLVEVYADSSSGEGSDPFLSEED